MAAVPIPGLSGYFVRADGSVWGPQGPRKPNSQGKLQIRGRSYSALRLVALAVLGPPPDPASRATRIDPTRPPTPDNVTWGRGGRPRDPDRRSKRRDRLEAAVQVGLGVYDLTQDVGAAVAAAAESAMGRL